MRPSHCKRVWRDGGVVHVLTLHLVDPRVAEIAATTGWDCLWVDLEHSPKTTADLERICRAVRAAAGACDAPLPDVMARPGKGEFMRLGRLLEAGAHGILYPRCESPDEARETVRWAKFAPLGERGFDGGNADNRYGAAPPDEYVRAANDNTWLAVQLESPHAVDQADDIAAVDGVDALFFGPGDYSCLTGVPGQFTADDVLAAARRVADAARHAGRVFATMGLTPDHYRAVRDMGCRMIACGADQGLLRRAMTDLRRSLAT
ncbi:MAG: HpcH/HpaI aldolase family protein [Planctomycetota bacterium]